VVVGSNDLPVAILRHTVASSRHRMFLPVVCAQIHRIDLGKAGLYRQRHVYRAWQIEGSVACGASGLCADGRARLQSRAVDAYYGRGASRPTSICYGRSTGAEG